MFLLRKNLFLVIIPDKFNYYRPNLLLFLFWVTNTVCAINCYLCQINFQIIIYDFNASLSVSSLLFSSTLCMSKQSRREYCSCWSMLSSRTFDLSVRADTFSFNFFIISFFPSRSFSYSSNLSVINLTDFERSASDCSPLICVCLFWSPKLLHT